MLLLGTLPYSAVRWKLLKPYRKECEKVQRCPLLTLP